MYPEAGGSSSFARRAFNEFASFFAAWAQMLNYTITIAISAFFVPHYFGSVIGVDALRHSPADIFFGIGVVVVLSLVNVVGVKESAGVNILLAVVDFLTQLLLVVVGLVLVFSPEHAGRQRPPRGRPDVEGLLPRHPGGDDRLHRHRDDLEHGRGGQGRDEDDPGRDQPRRHRRLRHLRAAADGRALGAAGDAAGRRLLLDAARRPRGPGRLRRRPGPRRGQGTWTWASCSSRARSTSACWRRRSSSSPPTRGSSASRAWSTRWACTARCPTACASCTRTTARRGSGSCSSGRSRAWP